MKKIIISISLVIAAMLCSTSCSDYLDIVPEGTPSMDNAFSNRINSSFYILVIVTCLHGIRVAPLAFWQVMNIG